MELIWDFNSEIVTGDSITLGLSIIPVSSAKQPFGKWKEYQSKIPRFHSGIITIKIKAQSESLQVRLAEILKSSISMSRMTPKKR